MYLSDLIIGHIVSSHGGFAAFPSRVPAGDIVAVSARIWSRGARTGRLQPAAAALSRPLCRANGAPAVPASHWHISRAERVRPPASRAAADTSAGHLQI